MLIRGIPIMDIPIMDIPIVGILIVGILIGISMNNDIIEYLSIIHG